MKNLIIILLLCVTNIFGQKISLIRCPYFQGMSNGNIVDYFYPSENLILSDGISIKFNVGEDYKDTYIHNSIVFRNDTQLVIEHLIFITKKDTIYFSSVGTLQAYGEDILIPSVVAYGKLKKNNLVKVVMIPRGHYVEITEHTPVNNDYF